MEDAFEEAYVAACRLCSVEPLEAVVQAVAGEAREGKQSGESKGEGAPGPVSIVLNGNSLVLFKERLQNHDVQAVAAAVKETGQLIDTLDLSWNALNDHVASDLVEIVLHGQVRHLDLSNNDLSAKGISSLLEVVESGKTSLETLSVAHNPIGPAGGVEVAKLLASTNCNLLELNLGSTDQDTSSLISIASSLKRNNTLRVVNLDNPTLFSFDDETTVHLAEVLKDHPSLERVSLAKHRIRCSGATVLADALNRNAVLWELNLRCNEISISGAQALAKLILSDVSGLRDLNLEGNRVADDGAIALGDALCHSHNLAHLNLENNSIHDAGLVALARGLAVNSSIKSVRLWNNAFGQKSSRLFHSLHNGRFQHLGVDLDILPYIADHLTEEERDDPPIHVVRK
ncbi:Leucine-rich repeat-containing protein 34 [Durusdinium trenchii]|uniref:Leucine-rich repeat-containing protein 34 n=1 Tax=Durusdinium trenchii TaxID=1381693 RepID=A0ABP0IT39_9DINO